MLGLKYLRTLKQLSLQDVADKMGVAVQTVGKWEKSRIIPPARVKQLANIFNVNEKYILEELSEIDKLEVQKIRLDNELKKTEIVETLVDDMTGKEATTIREYIDVEDMIQISKVDFEIRKRRYLKKIEESLDACLQNTNKDNDEVLASLDNANDLLKFYEDFCYLVNNAKVNKDALTGLMKAIDLYYTGKFSTDRFTSSFIKGVINLIDKKYKKD